MKEISNWFERSTKKSENEIELERIREYQTWTILWSSSALISCWNQGCKLKESSAMVESMQRREGMQKERMTLFLYIAEIEQPNDQVKQYKQDKWPN